MNRKMRVTVSGVIENKKRGVPTLEIILRLEIGMGMKYMELVKKAAELLKPNLWRLYVDDKSFKGVK